MTEPPDGQPSEDEVAGYFATFSNTGRWGGADELGTLNLITAAHRVKAARLVERGAMVSLAHPIRPNVDDTVRQAMLPPGPGPKSASDRVDISPHGFHITHLDALGHVAFRETVYNGRNVQDVIGPDGLGFGSIAAAAGGIVTRGLLLDVATARGLDYLEPGELVEPEDLDAACALVGVRPEPGDAALVRVGLGLRVTRHGPEDPAVRAGLSPRCVGWFVDHGIALFGGDCIERLPSGYPSLPLPFHAIALAAVGLAILDNVDMERLREACERYRRSAFMLVVAPLPIERATGSAVNPLALF